MLNHVGATWRRDDNPDPRKYAHGKLPVLRVNDTLIHDSDNIRIFLEQQGGDFWGVVSERDKAMGRGLIRMVEDHLYFHIVHDRWVNDAVWPTIKAAYFGNMPALLRGPITRSIRKDVTRGLNMQGLGRMTEAERLTRLDQDLDAIRALLSDRRFLLGDTPSLPDFSVAAILEHIAGTPVKTPTSRRVADDQALMAYVARMKDIYE